ncbi:MAG TPA: glycoside hydrolase family 78 protein [Chitinophagaceae bacterium]|nr:glycoside hydrolase family 78 protein [Chitinophagaceae bacterium]
MKRFHAGNAILLTANKFAAVMLCSLAVAYTALAAPPRAYNLRCEYLINPLGIDAANPRFTWILHDERAGARQSAYQILVSTDSLELRQGRGAQWNSGMVRTGQSLVKYGGRALQPFTKYYWGVHIWDRNRVKTALSIASFETGMMGQHNWKGSWISDGADIEFKPAPYFRKAFDVTKKIKTARVYIAVAGLYEMYINGSRIGNQLLDPAYTRYDRRTLYVVHDVTQYLTSNRNAIGIILGNGWYNHQPIAVWNFHTAPWRARPAFCMDLRITYEDGSVQTIASGNDWKTATGSIVYNNIYVGDHINKTLEPQNWEYPAFNDSAWKHAQLRAAPSQNIVAQAMHPIRAAEQLQARSVNKINDTTWVFDMGRNIAGISILKTQGKAGTIVRIKHGERLYDNGRVDMSNIDIFYRPKDSIHPFQTDVFTLAGHPIEFLKPVFNYKGFQYVEVTASAPLQFTAQDLLGWFMHSDVPATGAVRSSNPLIDQIWKATNNSYLSNLFGYPTDCPQREKNGWTGDAHIAIETGLYNFDGITIYEKWLADHRDEQQPNGVLPAIIPTSGWGYHWANGPDWTSTIAIIPWTIYLFYGDTTLLKDCYGNIERYVNHIDELYPSGLTTWGLGDWVPIKSRSPVEFTSSIFYYHDVSILANAAAIFNKPKDHAKYSALAQKIKDAINKKYLDRTKGVYGSGLQTELSFALHYGIVPEEMESTVAANLAKAIAANNHQLDVGLLGTKSILNALSDNGYADMAYMLASRDSFPSWGWWIVNGATTLYENWRIDAKHDLSMNHIMFGEIGAWMYKALAGIRPDPAKPGFQHILLEPHFVSGLNYFEASYNSPKGTIVSHWKREGGKVRYHVELPPNTTATLTLGLEGKHKKLIRLEAGKHVFEVN